MFRKLSELILMFLFFGICFWANAGQASQQDSQQSAAKPQESAVISFLPWKTQRIQSAQKALRQQQLSPEVNERAGDLARQLEYNLEMAHGLTILDYYALYLKNRSPQDLSEVAKSLSSSEVTELLVAYGKLLNKPSPEKAVSEAPATQK